MSTTTSHKRINPSVESSSSRVQARIKKAVIELLATNNVKSVKALKQVKNINQGLHEVEEIEAGKRPAESARDFFANFASVKL